MGSSVDHASIGVADLDRGISTFTALGFDMHVAGDCAYAYTDAEALELVAAGEPLGLRYIAIAGDDPPDSTGFHLGPLRFIAAPGHRQQRGHHPNGVLRLERAYVVVPDLAATVDVYAQLLSLPVPPVQRGNVIKADMCIFDIGTVGIGITQPVEPGPAADALEQRGPGPFQLLFRTSSLAAAAGWMTDHDLSPVRGTRNTGEAAILVGPHQAGGLYMAFVGPE
jgi:hypothetical protein